MKTTNIGISLAVLALIGQADAIDLARRHSSKTHHSKTQKMPVQNDGFVQTSKSDEFEEDNGDAYMAESIKEAEQEYALQ